MGSSGKWNFAIFDYGIQDFVPKKYDGIQSFQQAVAGSPRHFVDRGAFFVVVKLVRLSNTMHPGQKSLDSPRISYTFGKNPLLS